MIITVQCPACATSFPVDTDKVPEGGVDARCSICADIFPVDKPSAEAEAGGAALWESGAEAVAEAAPPAVEEAEPAPGAEAGVEREPEIGVEPEGEAGPDLEDVIAPDLEDEAEPDFEDEAEPDFEDEAEADVEAEAAGGWLEVEAAEPGAEEGDRDEAAAGWDLPSEAGVETEPAADEALEAELTTEWEDEPEPTAADEALEAELTTEWEDEREPTADDEILEAELTTEWEDEPEPSGVDEVEPMSGWEDEPDDPGGTEEEHDDVVTAAWDVPAVEDDSIETEPVAEEDAGPETVEAEVEEDTPAGTGFDVGAPGSGGAFETEDLSEAAATFEPDEPDTGVVPDTVEPPSEPPAGFQFGKRDPHEKAQRLARVLVSDMIMYNPERHGRALDGGTLKEDFEDEIAKSWDEYVDQVGEEIARSTTYFSDALNEILARGEPLFEGNPPR